MKLLPKHLSRYKVDIHDSRYLIALSPDTPLPAKVIARIRNPRARLSPLGGDQGPDVMVKNAFQSIATATRISVYRLQRADAGDGTLNLVGRLDFEIAGARALLARSEGETVDQADRLALEAELVRLLPALRTELRVKQREEVRLIANHLQSALAIAAQAAYRA